MDTKKGKSYPIGKANDGEKTFLILPGEIPYLNLKTRLKGDILDKTKNVKHFKEIAKPLHYQRIQKALNIKPFTNSLASIDLSDSDDEENGNNSNRYLNDSNGVDSVSTNEYFNFSDVSSERKWLADILQETNNGGPDDVQYKHILKLHEYSKRVRHGCKNINKYMHYGAGLISTVDQYKAKEATHESQKHQVSETVTSNSLRNDVKTEIKSESRKRKRDQSVPPPVQSPLYPPNLLDDITDEPCLDLNLDATLDFHFEDDIANIPTSFDYTMPTTSMAPLSINTDSSNKKLKNKKFKDDEAKKKWEDMMTAKRKRFFIGIVKKEVGKQQRSKINRHKEMLIQCKKVAQQCAKAVRQKALYSSRIMKEQQWRMKRLARENIAYWKRSRRLDREVKKRMEKEAEEQRKIDHELVEAKRQQRKLNFLITQTELYAHFMSKKLGQVSPEEQLRILNQLDEEKNPKLISIDDYDSYQSDSELVDDFPLPGYYI